MEDDIFHIKTIQPFLVFETKKFYQRVIASCEISHFYSFSGSDKTVSVPFLADGCSNIIFCYDRGNINAYVLGQTLEQGVFTIKSGADYFGIRFQPGENPCFEDLDVKDMAGKELLLSDFSDMRLLIEKMTEQTTFTTRMCTFMEEYRHYRNKKVSSQHQLYRQIIRLIVAKKGMLKISELEVLTGYSARYINHIFENHSGMSAKQFCGIVRIQFVVSEMNKGNVSSFSKLASDYRYYDQAHFIHEFKQYTGKTPSEYSAEVERCSYKANVINI